MGKIATGVLIAGIAAGWMWLYFRNQKPIPTPPKQEPTYLVMAKRIIDRPSGYFVQYKLLGANGDVLAQCHDPKLDGTGCEKYKTMETYALEQDATGRFLFDRKDHRVYLTIKAEGLWSDKEDDKWEIDSEK